jgi:hypothetical protein
MSISVSTFQAQQAMVGTLAVDHGIHRHAQQVGRRVLHGVQAVTARTQAHPGVLHASPASSSEPSLRTNRRFSSS